MSKHGDYKIVSGLINAPINDDGSYALSGYALVLELTKSFDIDQLQDLNKKIHKLKLEVEKQILAKV